MMVVELLSMVSRLILFRTSDAEAAVVNLSENYLVFSLLQSRPLC